MACSATDEMLAESVWNEFSVKHGSNQIATMFALNGLLWWLAYTKPLRILEVGTGIGTITALIARWAWAGFNEPDLTFWTVENDDLCRITAQHHVGPIARRIGWAREVPDASFDFLVLDGPQWNGWPWPLRRQSVVFIEGNRRQQRAQIERVAAALRVPWCRAQWKPADRSKGYWVYRFCPTPWERLWFSVVRRREWMRDVTRRDRMVPVGKKRRGGRGIV